MKNSNTKKNIMSRVLSVTITLFVGLSAVIAQTTFNYTGSLQTYVVPVGVFNVDIEAYGAQGGHGGPVTTGQGGLGGYSIGTLAVTPGQTLNIYVGGQGQSYILSVLTGGFNGGGGTEATSDDNQRPGCGGGASDVRVGGTALADRVIVAGGGGGASGWMNSNGGMGGGLVGQDGQAPLWQPTWFGKGGTQVAGGVAGGSALPGVLGDGGRGKGNSHGGGGGGGGYYGGGGGNVDAGGGGSSYIGGVSGASTVSGMQIGDGMIIITASCSPSVSSLVADMSPLADVNVECSANPSAPTATNDCGTIPGTPDVALPITTQGTTIVTWTYDDGVNIVTQTQNVIVNDATAPVADSATLPDINAQCDLDTLIAPSATDNCAGSIVGTTTTMLPILNGGTTVVTWTFDDGNGNVTTQTQNVINPTVDASVSQNGGTLMANGLVAAYQWLDCDNNFAPIPGEVNQYYTPTPVIGNYAVEVMQGNCVDTSICYLIDFTNVDEIFESELIIYPNPTFDGNFTIDFEGILQQIDVVDMLGRKIILPVDLSSGKVDGSNLSSGKYMVRVVSEDVMMVTEITFIK